MRKPEGSTIRWTIAIALALLASIVIMVAAARHDSEGIWGQTTAAWLQAVGSILAILIALSVANSEVRQAGADARLEKCEDARAAIALAHKTLELVADRLMVACDPSNEASHGMALREHRTNELIEALRQISVGDLPPEIVVPFSSIRSNLHAVNARITEIYESEEADGIPEERRRLRLGSGLIIYSHAVRDYADLCSLLRTQIDTAFAAFHEQPRLTAYVAMARAAASTGQDASDE
ncbi:hypothetical protein FHS95_000085 [Sphingomonas naasensis]|uniref:Uncharacterized protein n=1 Tax=Sphingomonas naasensis TaxID=1344951 RepID=A0A4S1WRQ6_9SPHN|nr:hypothetical protein [Sphingomonas naasensis]NIJ18416.1 hypothetical protein [Sphingomonas naasensis]TGX45683.1 hypothetical protein E5A74_00425 [Sphingomonas naasensis]